MCSRCRCQRRCRRRCLLVCPIARQQFISARSLLSSDATSAATQRLLLLRSLALLCPRAVARASLVEGERRQESALRRRCSLSVCLHVCICSGSACLCCALSQQQRRVLSLSLSLLLLLLCALITPERVVVVVRVVVAVRVVVPVHFVVIAAAVWFFFFGFGNVVERAPALRVAPSTSLLPSSSLSLLQLNCNEHVAATQPPLPLLLLPLLLVSFDFYFVFGFFGKFVKFSSPTLRWLPLSLPPLLLSHSPSFSVSLVLPLLLASTLICLNCFLINYQRHFLFIVCQAIFFFFFTSFLSSLFWRLYSL